MRLTHLSARFGLLFVTMLGLLLILELAAGLFIETPWGQPIEERRHTETIAWSQYAFEADAALGYRLAPNFQGRVVRNGEFDAGFRTNSHSIRDREFPPRDAATRRILFLGDSFVFGTGVEQDETFVKVLEQRLNAREGWQVEVINGGVGGYDIAQYDRWMDQLLPVYQPDLILVGLFLGNDFRRYPDGSQPPQPPTRTVVDGYRVSRSGGTSLWIRQHSRLGYFVLNRMTELRQRIRPPRPRSVADAELDVRSALPYLNSIHSKSLKARAELAFVVIPAKWQFAEFDDPEFDPNLHRLTDAVHGHLLDGLAAEGYAFLDLMQDLQNDEFQKLYFRVDGHFSKAGNRATAIHLDEWIAKQFSGPAARSARVAPAQPPSSAFR